MSTIVDSYFSQHRELANYLLQNNEISLKSDADRRFTKILILACASYFEDRVISAVSDYCSYLLDGNEKVMSLLKMKAFERQYHTLFDWKENNANKFFSYFGESIKQQHKDDIRNDENIKKYEKDFMFIGRTRNVLVHSNFAVASIEETHEEIYEIFKSALKFLIYIESMFETNG